jgi:hypothetical protein
MQKIVCMYFNNRIGLFNGEGFSHLFYKIPVLAQSFYIVQNKLHN